MMAWKSWSRSKALKPRPAIARYQANEWANLRIDPEPTRATAFVQASVRMQVRDWRVARVDQGPGCPGPSRARSARLTADACLHQQVIVMQRNTSLPTRLAH